MTLGSTRSDSMLPSQYMASSARPAFAQAFITLLYDTTSGWWPATRIFRNHSAASLGRAALAMASKTVFQCHKVLAPRPFSATLASSHSTAAVTSPPLAAASIIFPNVFSFIRTPSACIRACHWRAPSTSPLFAYDFKTVLYRNVFMFGGTSSTMLANTHSAPRTSPSAAFSFRTSIHAWISEGTNPVRPPLDTLPDDVDTSGAATRTIGGGDGGAACSVSGGGDTICNLDCGDSGGPGCTCDGTVPALFSKRTGWLCAEEKGGAGTGHENDGGASRLLCAAACVQRRIPPRTCFGAAVEVAVSARR
mmetsp:Transcript_113225/g.320471  ORF Transcript_113225/g.320471 Transcript_113225/m.320471 type:complete len:307 (-) Transcript_113225:27-947(-)